MDTTSVRLAGLTVDGIEAVRRSSRARRLAIVRAFARGQVTVAEWEQSQNELAELELAASERMCELTGVPF